MYQSDMLIAIDPQRVPDAFVRSTVTLATEQRMDAISVKVLSRTDLLSMIEEFKLYEESARGCRWRTSSPRCARTSTWQLERGRPNPRGPEPYSAFHVRFTYTDPEHRRTGDTAARLAVRAAEHPGPRRAGRATNAFLETQLEEARTRLEAQERRLEAFRERHGKALPTQMQSNMQAITERPAAGAEAGRVDGARPDRKQMLERLYATP